MTRVHIRWDRRPAQPAAEALRKTQSSDIKQRYRQVFRTFDRIYDNQTILIDSSKLLSVLKIVRTMTEVDLKVIYLIRDVRAWTISRLNHRVKNPDYYGPRGNYVKRLVGQFGWKAQAVSWAFPFATKMPAYHFWLWFLQNKDYANNSNNNYNCNNYKHSNLCFIISHFPLLTSLLLFQ